MIFIDFDDTWIPTKLFTFLRRNYCINIFELLSLTEMTTLQNTIIGTLENVKKQCIANNEDVEFCVVSNAAQDWLDDMFQGRQIGDERGNSYLPALHKYLQENEIPIISAKQRAIDKIKATVKDEAEVNTIINDFDYNANYKDKRWVWKYETFESVINRFEKKLKQKCGRIISIGDGNDEQKAIKHYHDQHNKCQALHIRLLQAPTVHQIIKQWQYLNGKACGYSMLKATNNESIYLHELSRLDKFACDNQRNFDGVSHQRSAVQSYFNLFIC